MGAHFAAASKAMDDDYESTVETLKDLAAGLNSMRQGAVKIVTASGNRKKVDSAVLELFPAMNLYVSADRKSVV